MTARRRIGLSAGARATLSRLLKLQNVRAPGEVLARLERAAITALFIRDAPRVVRNEMAAALSRYRRGIDAMLSTLKREDIIVRSTLEDVEAGLLQAREALSFQESYHDPHDDRRGPEADLRAVKLASAVRPVLILAGVGTSASEDRRDTNTSERAAPWARVVRVLFEDLTKERLPNDMHHLLARAKLEGSEGLEAR